jgi:two-component system, probable response regulator PhcQ
MRIILTGQADIKATIAAINEVGIYRFLTKPWNTYELMITVQNAIQYKILKMENEKLLQKIKAQSETLTSLEKKYPGITSLPKMEDGTIIIRESE